MYICMYVYIYVYIIFEIHVCYYKLCSCCLEGSTVDLA